jgi:hypothetical protein
MYSRHDIAEKNGKYELIKNHSLTQIYCDQNRLYHHCQIDSMIPAALGS